MKVEKVFEYKGFECIVTLSFMGHRCGYVNVKNTKLEGVDYDSLQYIDVHGGLTYSDSKMHDREESEGDWWLGWDYGHFGDGLDKEAVAKTFAGEKAERYLATMDLILDGFWFSGYIYTTDDVVRDCKQVVEQIIKLEE